MARNNKSRLLGWGALLLAVLWLGGCTSTMQARSAFDEAEQLAGEERFDQAVVKYQEATELEPGSKTYKLKMIASKTRAAASHIKTARVLAAERKFPEAIEEYRRARGFDPSLEVAAQEEKQLHKMMNAQTLAEEGASFYSRKNLILAKKAIDKALELDANNERALAIKDLLDRDQHTLAMDGIELDIASTEPITLRFKDANIKEVFGILSQLSGINFIFDEEIRSQSVTVLLEKASFAQAMQLIMQMNGLGKKVLNSKTIIIFPQTREKEKQYEDQLIQTFYLSHIDAKKAVNLLRTMLQLRKIYVHEERNALVVRDKPETIELAEQILLAADRSDAEVLFDVEVLAVRDQDNLNFGPQLAPYSVSSAAFTSSGERVASTLLGGTDATSSVMINSLNGVQAFYTLPAATFDFQKTLATTELLASPKIRVKNNEKAKVHIGKRDPIVTTSGSATDSNYQTQNVQYVDSGIKLDIEPNVQLDGTVLTKIKLEVSSAERLDSGDKTGESPIALTTTNAETALVLIDGERTILGGLFESNKNHNKTTIPFIGDIPLLGSLFTNFANTDEKREIILSITPYIVKNLEVPATDVATIWSGGEDNLKVGPNFGAFAKALVSEVEGVKPLAAPAVKSPPSPVPKPATKNMTVAPEVVQPSPAPADIGAVPPSDPLPVKVEAPSEQEPPPAAETVAPLNEIVPTESLPQVKEVGAPLVLEMPPKAPASIVFVGPKQAQAGKEFALEVEVKGVERLYSAPLFIQYDPAALELVGVNEGTFLKQNDSSTVFSNSPNRTTGQVIVGYKQGTGGAGASGSGTLFTLNFKPITAGETRVEVNRVNFRSPDGVRLQVAPEAAVIDVR